jgi:hypothetical protein
MERNLEAGGIVWNYSRRVSKVKYFTIMLRGQYRSSRKTSTEYVIITQGRRVGIAKTAESSRENSKPGAGCIVSTLLMKKISCHNIKGIISFFS